MASALTFLEPGGDATFTVTNSNGFWQVVNGTCSVATDFVHGTHVKSIKYATGSTSNVGTASGTVLDSGTIISTYVYFNALPTGNAAFLGANPAGFGNSFSVALSSGGVLSLYTQNTSTLLGTGATLSTGQWYRISIGYTVTSSSVYTITVYVNGVSSITVTNGASINTGSNQFTVGNISGDATLDMRSSDHFSKTGTTNDPGNVWVTAKRPYSNGTVNNYTAQIGSGGSGYGSGHAQQVNERPINTADGWSGMSFQTEEYTIEGQSVGDINITGATILGLGGWFSASIPSGTSTPSFTIGGNNESPSKTLSTTISVLTAFVITSTYPGGGNDVGIVNSTATLLYECGVLVAYIPGSGSANSGLINFC